VDIFLGQLLIVPMNFAPQGWAFAAGQLMAISQATALFSLLGTTYGGDGRVTFGLPNLNGNIPVGAGQGPGLSDYYLGQTGGAAAVTLIQSEMPSHNHSVQAAVGRGIAADSQSPAGNAIATVTAQPAGTPYLNATVPKVALALEAVLPSGNSQPHNNMMPYLALNYIIATQGMFPQRP